MAQLNVGLIGCGSIALSAHLPAMQHLTSLAKLRWVCDIRRNAAEQTARSAGIDRWTTEYRQILDDPAVDAVVITTPEFLHAEQTIAAAEAGKHILCEKPISATLAEADAMIEAAERAGVKLFIAHSRRFTRRYQEIRRLLDEGTIGEPVLIRENERRPRAQYSVLNLPVDIWQPDPERGREWKDLKEYSGGVARGHAIHEMDLFRWFAGSDAVSVMAASQIILEGREVPDTLSFQVDFENGTLAACDLYTQAPTGYPYYHQLEIFGTEGLLRARDSDMIAVSRFDAGGMSYPTAYETLLHINDAYIEEHRLFYEAMIEDSDVPLDPRDARAALEMSLAATQSAETGRRVRLPLGEGE